MIIRHASTLLLLVGFLCSMAQTANADPASWVREGWRTDFSQHAVDLSEITSGGPPKDGIPAIDDPRFATADKVEDLQPREPVIQLTVNGITRGYPVRILMFHEIVNDTLAGVPVAVTFCPLCNAAIVFRRVVAGQPVDFGTTGKLRNSDLVMYDRQSESWWQQFTGEAIAGTRTGTSLKRLPSSLVSWDSFRRNHPDAEVLEAPENGGRAYGTNPYVRYDTAATPFLYSGEMPEGIEPMAHVVIVRKGQGKGEGATAPILVALAKLRESGHLLRDGYKLEWSKGQASALDTRNIAEGREVGTVSVLDPQGSPALFETTFAFVAHAFHPDVAIEQ